MPVETDKYQEVTIAIVVSIIVFWILVGCIIYFIIYYQRRRFQHVREKADIQLAFEKDILQSKIEIQEQAFNNISRELHDNVGQQLSLAKLNLGTLKEIHHTPDKEKIESAKELVSNSIYQIRSISKTLLGEKVNSIGLAEAVKNEADRINKLGTLTISFAAPRQIFALSPQKEIILFRIIQESLNNIIRHAAANRAALSIECKENRLTVLIQDNGKGFNLASEGAHGIGIMNMRNRAQTIGAVLTIDSLTGKGTTVRIELDCQ